MNEDNNLSENTNTPPSQENENAQPLTAIDPTPPKRQRRSTIIISALLVLALITVGLLVVLRKDTPEGSSGSKQQTNQLTLNNPNKPASKYNRSSTLFAIGNVTYEPEKLQELTSDTGFVSKLNEIQPVQKEANLSSVAFVETGDDVYTRRLVMYDFATGKARIIHEDKGDEKVRHYYHPVILSDHYVAWYTMTYETPVDLKGKITVADLNTGDENELLNDDVANLPENLCCSVSPDGLYLVMPLPPNKIAFYSAGGEKTQEITANISTLPHTEGQDDNGYAQAMRASGYPALQWLDNKRVVLATNAPISYKVDGDGTHIAKDTNGLDILDLESGKQTNLVKTGTYSIPWFEITDKNVVFASHTASETLSGGPVTGNVNLYTAPLNDTSAPKMVEGLTHDKQGALVLDKRSGVLYIQENDSSSIIAFNTSDFSQTTYTKGMPPFIRGVIDSDTLVGSYSSELSSPLQIYKLSTGETLE